jgi:hypothetical protein
MRFCEFANTSEFGIKSHVGTPKFMKMSLHIWAMFGWEDARFIVIVV